MSPEGLDVKTLENWLWEAACPEKVETENPKIECCIEFTKWPLQEFSGGLNKISGCRECEI